MKAALEALTRAVVAFGDLHGVDRVQLARDLLHVAEHIVEPTGHSVVGTVTPNPGAPICRFCGETITAPTSAPSTETT